MQRKGGDQDFLHDHVWPLIDHQHPLSLILLNQLIQQMSFGFGLYLGMQLLRGQEAYFSRAEVFAQEGVALRSAPLQLLSEHVEQGRRAVGALLARRRLASACHH